MILTFDVGNTQVAVCGVASGEIIFRDGFATALYREKDGYLPALEAVLQKNKVEIKNVSGTILSSVVPDADKCLSEAITAACGKEPMMVKADTETGMKVKGYDLSCLGADRLIVAMAAAKSYGYPVCVYDLGTATTLSVVDREGCFVGGAISAGVQLSLDALGERCARLPLLNARSAEPERVIGNDVKTCMESGALIGCAALVDGMVLRTKKELGCSDSELKVVLTGGNAPFVHKHLLTEGVILDTDLIHKGLYYVYKNVIRPERI